jgi:hypothetical protein
VPATQQQFKKARENLNNAIIAEITEFNSADSPGDLMARLLAIRSLVEDFRPGPQARVHIAQAIAKLTEDVSGPKR